MKRFVPIQMTENEIAERGRMAASLTQEQTRVEEERKASDTRYKERVGGLRNRISSLMTEIREGSRFVEVECVWRVDFPRNVKELRRMDTGEVIETEVLSAADRQAELFALDGGKHDDLVGGMGGEEEAQTELG